MVQMRIFFARTIKCAQFYWIDTFLIKWFFPVLKSIKWSTQQLRWVACVWAHTFFAVQFHFSLFNKRQSVEHIAHRRTLTEPLNYGRRRRFFFHFLYIYSVSYEAWSMHNVYIRSFCMNLRSKTLQTNACTQCLSVRGFRGLKEPGRD